MNEYLENAKAQMRKGVLEYCILSVLSEGDAYVSDIIRRLKEAQMIVVEGTLYPLLMRQKNAGWLAYRWEESTQGPPRKYYAITDAGRQLLAELDTAWQDLGDSVIKIRQPEKTHSHEKRI
ncbi:MAG: PadR family transcriptional regulator [Bacteroidales bacterium]|jgi:PadR family transcriptional regulator PadR|nr:PadR family transcriptional regulator [Bacteroidales bacterium]